MTLEYTSNKVKLYNCRVLSWHLNQESRAGRRENPGRRALGENQQLQWACLDYYCYTKLAASKFCAAELKYSDQLWWLLLLLWVMVVMMTLSIQCQNKQSTRGCDVSLLEAKLWLALARDDGIIDITDKSTWLYHRVFTLWFQYIIFAVEIHTTVYHWITSSSKR